MSCNILKSLAYLSRALPGMFSKTIACHRSKQQAGKRCMQCTQPQSNMHQCILCVSKSVWLRAYEETMTPLPGMQGGYVCCRCIDQGLEEKKMISRMPKVDHNIAPCKDHTCEGS
jgi:hypothetical protein